MTTLDPHFRGDAFDKTVTLDGAASYYTGGLRFTLRRTIPASTVVTDADAVAKATTSPGEGIEGEVFVDGANVRVYFASSVTNGWPVGRLYWDLQGKVTDGAGLKTIDSGEIMIRADITRTP